ncbi:uncharacterized protein LOC132546823 [Ylistrum balloti]|uniref:uncharacterized protein LOC132546823 n=1 Tax=Ylistrum balloti TaxID=509963 RepID=UPI0029058C99|nr:uncharacterized protein LOC132546823 [Ylistrum balloti]
MALTLHIALVVIVLCQHASHLAQGATLGTTEAVTSEGASESLVIEGVDVSTLSEDDLESFLSALDEKFLGELDIEVGKRILENATSGGRAKRWIPLAARGAFALGRGLFRAVSRAKISRSAGRITRQYDRRGNFKKAVSDFHRLKPTDVKRFKGKDGLVGLQGRLGKQTVKVRSNSSGNRPTLEVYRTDKAARKIIRKVRYDKKN